MLDCPKWEAEQPPFKKDMTEEDFSELQTAMKNHLAVCGPCRRECDETTKKLGRVATMPVALLFLMAEETVKRMKADGSTLGMDSMHANFVITYFLPILQDWKLISWNESMLAIREEWALKEKGENPGTDRR